MEGPVRGVDRSVGVVRGVGATAPSAWPRCRRDRDVGATPRPPAGYELEKARTGADGPALAAAARQSDRFVFDRFLLAQPPQRLENRAKKLLDKAEQVLERMERAEVRADTVTFNSLLDGYVKKDKLDKAER